MENNIIETIDNKTFNDVIMHVLSEPGAMGMPTIDNLYALSELFQVPIDAMLVGNRKIECRCQNDMYQRMLVYYEKLNELRGSETLYRSVLYRTVGGSCV